MLTLQFPVHARNVSLVLSLTTGLVSPQFHCNHDDFFETVSRAPGSTASSWKRLLGFVVAPRSEREISADNNIACFASPRQSNSTPSSNFDQFITEDKQVPPLATFDNEDNDEQQQIDAHNSDHGVPHVEIADVEITDVGRIDDVDRNSSGRSVPDDAHPDQPPSSSRGRPRTRSSKMQDSLESQAWGRGTAYYMAA